MVKGWRREDDALIATTRRGMELIDQIGLDRSDLGCTSQLCIVHDCDLELGFKKEISSIKRNEKYK